MRTQVLTSRVKTQQGIALIEALIAILLFSLGILALAGLQGTMVKNVTQSKLRGEASYLANQLIGQMWVDQANLTKYKIASKACSTSHTPCTSWLASVQQALPQGNAEVTIDSGVVNVKVSWQLSGEEPNELQIDANIIN